ncbi:autotransporter-associated beta strand protein [Comamonas odontotermitis]|uniref:Autotransporter-associated beta strand protein n=1 Tax=Comamonas odontotermitis TaxID=379895 RepID=A0ABR6RA52_9BURK|nr:IPTL-CTERM sorting domain-containing protein [Comamonas odontotermitis]MBB6576013.1 autotransporter-associated beta strand protein [Comamonas odontotermitis]
MAVAYPFPRPRHKRAPQWHSIQRAIFVALAPAWAASATAQVYTNYDGSPNTDLAAAAQTWADHGEFKGDWGLGAMNAQFAYARGFSGKDVKVGSVDSGLRLNHVKFVNRDPVAITISGTYLNSGYLVPPTRKGAWNAGDAFNVNGAINYDFTKPSAERVNDNHGSHVSGTIAAAKTGDATSMMGVAFNSKYYIANTNGADAAIYGSNMDYNYFKAAYGDLIAQGVRVTNSSWGSPGTTRDTSTLTSLVRNFGKYFLATHARLEPDAKDKTWLDAVVDVTRGTQALQVFAAGNTQYPNVNLRSAVPFFKSDIEANWIAVPALANTAPLTLASFSQHCGLAKYWCVSAPGSGIRSLSAITEATQTTAYANSSGTSMAAPHVTGALGVLMERYPTLSNQAVRTVLLTTSRHLGDGPEDVPNARFGWGVPDMDKAMSGPSQLLGTFEAQIADGATDVWTNPISEAALKQRKMDDQQEIADWPANRDLLQKEKFSIPAITPEVLAGYENALVKLKAIFDLPATPASAADNLRNELLADVTYGKPLLAALEDQNLYPDWRTNATFKTTYDKFINGRDLAAMAAYIQSYAKYNNISVDAGLAAWQARIDQLAAKTDADYVGTLAKTGAGSLTLAANATHTGGTRIDAGSLRTGVETALATSQIAIASGATLDITASGNASVAGIRNGGTVNLADGIAGQTLTVNGPWVGQQGTVKLDLAPAAAAKSAAATTKAAVVPDTIVINGAVSGQTTLSLSGLQNIDPVTLNGLQLIKSTQPVPANSFVLSAPLVINGQTYALQSSQDGGLMLALVTTPPATATAVPSLGTWALGMLSALLAGFAALGARRRRAQG